MRRPTLLGALSKTPPQPISEIARLQRNPRPRAGCQALPSSTSFADAAAMRCFSETGGGLKPGRCRSDCSQRLGRHTPTCEYPLGFLAVERSASTGERGQFFSRPLRPTGPPRQGMTEAFYPIALENGPHPAEARVTWSGHAARAKSRNSFGLRLLRHIGAAGFEPATS